MTSEFNRKIFELTLAVYRVTDIFPKDEVLKRQIREKSNEILAYVCEYDRKIGENGIRTLLSKIQAIRTYLGVARFANLAKAVNAAVLDREYEFFVNFFERELIHFAKGVKREENSVKTSQIKAVTVFTDPNISSSKPKKDSNNSGQPDNMPTFAKWTSNGANGQKVSLENSNGNGNNNGNSRINHLGNNGFNERQQTILDYIRTNQQVKSTDLASIFSNKFSIKTLQRDLAALIGSNTVERQGDKRWAVYKLKG